MKRIICYLIGHRVGGPWSAQRGSNPTVYTPCLRCWTEVVVPDAQWPSKETSDAI